MRKLTISDFKVEEYDTIQIIEKLSSFDINNPKKTLLEILEASNDCDSIVEAIFYKKEKMKRGLDCQKDQILEELTKELKTEISGIHINEVGNSMFILEQRKVINELTRIKRILMYATQMKDQFEQILDGLLKSEDIEEWKFLADLIYTHITFSKSHEIEIFTVYSKKLEEKISDAFKKSISSGNIELSKACFEIAMILDKEFALIDEFLVIKNLFTSKMAVHPPIISKIELSGLQDNEHTFKAFLKDTETIIANNFDFICIIFGQKDEYIDYILSKIYRTLISINLGNFLNVSNPPIFLNCLQSAAESINSFGKVLKCFFQKFDYLSCTTDIFSVFIFTAILKEKQVFAEILDVYLNGLKALNSYSIGDEPVQKSNDFMFIFGKILIVINAFISRSEKLYSKEIYKEVLESFSNKMCSLVEKMTLKYKSKINLVNDLIYMYIANCRLFGDKGESLQKFNEKLKEAIAKEFEEQIQSSQLFLKNEISNLFFTQPDSHKKLQNYLERLFESQGLLGEKNFKVFACKIANSLYNFLYRQVQFININQEVLARMHRCIDDLFVCLPLVCSAVFLPKFNHLKNLTNAVIIGDSEFEKILSQVPNPFNESEIKYLSKCRSKKTAKNGESSKSKA